MSLKIYQSTTGVDPRCQVPVVAVNRELWKIKTTNVICNACVIPVKPSSSSSSSGG